MNHRVTTASADRPLTTQPSTAALWLAHVSVASVNRRLCGRSRVDYSSGRAGGLTA